MSLGEKVTDTPDGLHELQYAAHICEFSLAWPANKSNLELVGECIRSVARKYRRSNKKAFEFLQAKIKLAEQLHEPVDGFWFREGKYMTVRAPEAFKGTHKPVTEAEWQAAQEDRKGFFASEEYHKFLTKMKTEHGL